MFHQDSEQSVLLGVPVLDATGAPTAMRPQQLASACLTRLGGLPAWHDAARAPTEALVCGVCGNRPRAQMLLVAQLYAPTHLHRGLYVA